MHTHLLAFAGVCLWTLSIAVVVQRQRVLHRRLVRLERMAGVRRRRPPVIGWARPVRVWHDDRAIKGQAHIGRPPPASDRVPAPPPAPRRPTVPTVTQLAALARPLQRAGG